MWKTSAAYNTLNIVEYTSIMHIHINGSFDKDSLRKNHWIAELFSRKRFNSEDLNGFELRFGYASDQMRPLADAWWKYAKFL